MLNWAGLKTKQLPAVWVFLTPFKFDASPYTSLRRGGLTVGFDTVVLKFRTAACHEAVGRQRRYLDIPLTICMTLVLVFNQPLRTMQELI